jgi:long-chain acyl-CoA synthetase
LTPSIAAALLRSSRDDTIARSALGGFRHVFCGTAPLHDALRSDFLGRFGRPLQESYGTSEQLLLSVQSPEDALIRRDVGTVLEAADLDFVESEPGIREIVVGSRHLGYLTGEGVVPPVTDEHGRTRTGDAGRLVDGRLEITGRLKDLIIRGGINVSPVAVENALADIDGVGDVAVVGLPHPFWGEIIVACLEIAPGADEQAVVASAMSRAQERLAKACRPDRVVTMPAFPRATTGKIQKRLLREGLAG